MVTTCVVLLTKGIGARPWPSGWARQLVLLQASCKGSMEPPYSS